MDGNGHAILYDHASDLLIAFHSHLNDEIRRREIVETLIPDPVLKNTRFSYTPSGFHALIITALLILVFWVKYSAREIVYNYGFSPPLHFRTLLRLSLMI